MKIDVKKILLVFFFSSLIIFRGSFPKPKSVSAQSNEEKLQQLNDQIKQYEAELSRLSSLKNTLANQIAQYDAQISLTKLKITQTEEKINLLGGRIDRLQVSLKALGDAFVSRVNQTYKMSRINQPYMYLLGANDLSEAVSSYHYLQRIQQSDQELLKRLEEAQTTYKSEKQDQEDLQNELEKQQNQLNAQKNAKSKLLEESKNDEKKYQQLLSEAKAQLSALRRFVSAQGGASILHDQTKCDGWGCYYNQRDAQWGNVGLGGSSYSTAEYGCLVTSVAMMATHYGKNITPLDIAINPSAFVPGTGYLYHSISVNGFNISLTSVSKELLDSELNAGRPVIAGLYSGPDHFIVILRKEGSSYIMNDPFLENGKERKLEEKYNVSDITTLRLINFN